MSLLPLRSKAFRIRNPSPEVETDEARLGTISSAISMALADARRERGGLGQQAESNYARAGWLRNNSDECGGPDRAGENTIRLSVHDAPRASQRMVQLDEQIRRLEALLGQVGRIVEPAETPNRSVA